MIDGKGRYPRSIILLSDKMFIVLFSLILHRIQVSDADKHFDVFLLFEHRNRLTMYTDTRAYVYFRICNKDFLSSLNV
mgnify:FL=1